MNGLKGKVVVVTGASKGIGASIAEHLPAEGSTVVVNYVSSKNSADAVVARINEKGGKAFAIQGDVSKPQDIQRLFSEIEKQFGRVDVLVNNAGTYEFAPLGSITPEHIAKHFSLNVTWLLLTQGRSKRNNDFAFTGTWTAKNPCEFAESADGGNGLRASGLNEGEFREQQEKTTPLGRIATPEDIALAATFLAGDDARWITGQVIVAAGGKRM